MATSHYLFRRRVLCGNRALHGLQKGLEAGAVVLPRIIAGHF